MDIEKARNLAIAAFNEYKKTTPGKIKESLWQYYTDARENLLKIKMGGDYIPIQPPEVTVETIRNAREKST